MEDLEKDGLIADFEVSSHSTETETNSADRDNKVNMNSSSSSSLSTEERSKTTLTEEEEEEEEEETPSTQDKINPALFNSGQLENAASTENFEVERCSTVAHSTSPSPKPTDFYIWQPMKPGYAVRLESPGLVALRRRLTAASPSTGQSESRLRQAIPAMPRLWSVVCCLLNVLLPGLGTLLSGLSILCCSRPRFAHLTRSDVVWTNAWVALLQLLTTILLLFGWIWSIVWGVSFVIVSNQFIGNETSQVDAVANRCVDHHRGAPASGERSATNSIVALSGSTTTRPSSIQTANVANSQTDPPIIVLHEAPLLVLRPSSIGADALAPWQPQSRRTAAAAASSCRASPADQRRSNQGRHQNTAMELLQQRDYPEMLLSPGALETIVIHHGAYFIQAQYPPSESSSRTPPPSADAFSAANGGGGGGGQKSTSSFARTMTTTSHH